MKDLETGELLAWEITRSFVDDRIASIVASVGASSSVLYLTDSKSNFRNEVATILPYKGHRPSDKPPHWEAIRQHLIDNYDAEVQYGIEADDACGILQCTSDEPTIICSRDKDLMMIPGQHYQWACGNQQEKHYIVTQEDGIRFFYKQLLTGDATDNILGLYRVGQKASCVKALDGMYDEYEMFEHVYSEYQSRFGSYAYQFLIENAQLLWIMRDNAYAVSCCDGAPPCQEAEIEDRLRHHIKRYNHEEEEGLQEKERDSEGV